ncbi:nicotinate phosphoribosyltransferase family-domain-containing protein [Dimargaris cristalligena]|uniref:Nicotinamide phosphoribosyltransferase n=1 Tax=Dimargaris cristalligena TaxID=215637 RepID=A0A4P9ZJZ4_9FUNG|nr:nicotinate phosphoribosyltransferase family-domain-containing protein [Dimargaris cristalligena]|eukprot:RKP33395.1 nicotinate phosphoribosyltransferase family-domain-containing protein [Dimargaris cristalligena]
MPNTRSTNRLKPSLFRVIDITYRLFWFFRTYYVCPRYFLDVLFSRLHDFGFRGCTSVEQSLIGGCAHLLNFSGSDTLSAAYYAQFHLNGGLPVATSIPATEHSVMTAYVSEIEAIRAVIDRFGTGVFACVMDSYDYVAALEKILPVVAQQKLAKGGFMVLRPDSGDPADMVLMGLRAAEKVFGTELNSKGFKVLKGCSVIQGDGVSYSVICSLLTLIQDAGFSAENVAFGMGGGLLQKVHRDTLSFATKLSYVKYANGDVKQVMKIPQTDKAKISMPGELDVYRDEQSRPTTFPRDQPPPTESPSLLQVVYDHGPLPNYTWDTFAQIRARANREWAAAPTHHNAISTLLQQKTATVLDGLRKGLVECNAENR